MKITKHCDNCGIEFILDDYKLKSCKRFYCNKTCWQTHDKAFNKDYFKVIDKEEKAYWLGMICSDGWLDKRDKAVGIQLQTSDSEILQNFADLFKVKLNHFNTHTKTTRVMVYSKTIFNDLISIGVLPNKSLLDISKVFEVVPNNLKHHFIRGIFDGDGSVYKTKTPLQRRRMGYTTGFSFVGEYHMMEKIRQYLFEVVNLSPSNVNKHKTIHSITWSGAKCSEKMFVFLYKDATIYLERKYDVFNNYLKEYENDRKKIEEDRVHI